MIRATSAHFSPKKNFLSFININVLSFHNYKAGRRNHVGRNIIIWFNHNGNEEKETILYKDFSFTRNEAAKWLKIG